MIDQMTKLKMRPKAKLTQDQVVEIKTSYLGIPGEIRTLASKFKVNETTILRIVSKNIKRNTWKDMEI